jgi:plastocyanin
MRSPGRRRLAAMMTLAIAAASLTGVAASSPAATKKKPKPVMVSVADFYFGPNAVTVKKGGSVKWVWAAANTEPHDVHLKKAPKGLKNKGSYSTKTTAVTNAHFQKTFETPGTYEFICTIHPTQMKMKITVKK